MRYVKKVSFRFSTRIALVIYKVQPINANLNIKIPSTWYARYSKLDFIKEVSSLGTRTWNADRGNFLNPKPTSSIIFAFAMHECWRSSMYKERFSEAVKRGQCIYYGYIWKLCLCKSVVTLINLHSYHECALLKYT